MEIESLDPEKRKCLRGKQKWSLISCVPYLSSPQPPTRLRNGCLVPLLGKCMLRSNKLGSLSIWEELYPHPQHTPLRLCTTQWLVPCSTKQQMRVLFSPRGLNRGASTKGYQAHLRIEIQNGTQVIESKSTSDYLKLQYQQGVSMLLRDMEADSQRTMFWYVMMIANGIHSHKGNFKIMKAI